VRTACRNKVVRSSDVEGEHLGKGVEKGSFEKKIPKKEI